MNFIDSTINIYRKDQLVQKHLLFSLITAHFLGADVLVKCEEAVEENQESHQGGRKEPGRVKSCNLYLYFWNTYCLC